MIQFRVRGSLRFVSHAEMLKVFQRACARAGLNVLHSQGFNPHPKISLPLPRPVGVESDDELLCVQVSSDLNESQIKEKLSEQLPDGCELLSVGFADTTKPIQPCSVAYVVPVKPEYINDKLRAGIEHLLVSESLIVKRPKDTKNLKFEIRISNFKTLDVRPFLKSIELDDGNIVVECKVTSSGSIRIEEIFKLLEIETGMLAAPVKRTKVHWQAA